MNGFTLKKAPLPGFITYEWLIRNHACPQAEIFRELYPEGTQITEEVIDALQEEWMDLNFLIGAAYEIYEENMTECFHKKTAREYKIYTETMKSLDDLSRKAEDEFQRRRILALYDITRDETLPTREGEQYRLDF